MPTWSKEDRISYDKSEVFQELEKLTIANIHRVDILRKRAAANAEDLAKTEVAANKANEALKQLNDTASKMGMAEDQVSEMESGDHSMMSGLSREMAEKMTNDAMDAKVSDAIVNELMEMKEAAIKEGNIKLAYKIERTLDEILSVETI